MAEENVETREGYRFELTEEQAAEFQRVTGQQTKAVIIFEDELREMAQREGRYSDSVAQGIAEPPR
ncbi:MAG TPA: hypothetical protein VGB73_04010 [Pyrinomonadaceae bacterium]